MLNNLCGGFGSLSTAGSQIPHFLSHYSKALAVLTGSSGLYSSVKSQNIGLEGNFINYLDNLGNIVGGFINIHHSLQHFLHALIAYIGLGMGITGQVIGFLGIASVVLGLLVNFGNRGRQLLYRGGLRGSTLGQHIASISDVFGTAGYLLGGNGNLTHNLIHLAGHFVKGIGSMADFVIGFYIETDSQIAIGHQLRFFC